MLYSGEELKKLIPQRDPIVQVDNVVSAAENEAVTELLVRADNCFVMQDGLMAENGLIEHIAQSASAFAGHRALAAGATNPPVGFIGEVKRYRLYQRPAVGTLLRTVIEMGAEVQGITIVTGKTCQVAADGTTGDMVAETMLKIFVEDAAKSQQAQQQAQVPQVMEGKEFFRVLDSVALDQEGKGSVRAELCPDCWLYRGHFPGRPVSPGVCNIGMIKGCAEFLSGQKLTYSDIRQCRLTAIASPQVCPVVNVSVTLTPTDGGYQIQAVIADQQQTYMELKGTVAIC